jgi:invasion protein IalB
MREQASRHRDPQSRRPRAGASGVMAALALLAISVPFAATAQKAPNGNPGAAGRGAAVPPGSPAITTTASVPERTETITYDSWTVQCHDVVGARSKRTCSAMHRVLDKDQRRVLLVWVIGLDKQSRLTSVLKVPTGLVKKAEAQTFVGLHVKSGLDLRLGNGPVRHLNYVSCEPQWCDAVGGMDEAFIKDAAAAQTASVVIYTPDEQSVPFQPIALKGIDRALAMLRQ